MDRGRMLILGSGETAPTMVQVHRSVLAAAGPGPALVLDTPYGFQENADALTQKALDYFQLSVGWTMRPLRWRTRLDGVELDRALTALRTARAVYAGPGSPTYTMRVWANSGLTEAIRTMIEAGGTAIFSSAAALTVGAVTLPAHEIYRCGADPYWVAGTNLLRELTGLSAAVIPHYDHSRGGGTHDTRFCYVGARRMRILHDQLPPGTHVIGVDEHTALVLDLAAGSARVVGRGAVTVRRDQAHRVLPAGSVTPLAELAELAGGPEAAEHTPQADAPPITESARPARTAAERAYTVFSTALAARDTKTAGAAILRLEQALAANDAGDRSDPDAGDARRLLRGMVVQLTDAAADGLVDLQQRLAPLVTVLLEQRTAARRRRDFAEADALRDQLASAGVTVRDLPHGVEWSLSPGARTTTPGRTPEQRFGE